MIIGMFIIAGLSIAVWGLASIFSVEQYDLPSLNMDEPQADEVDEIERDLDRILGDGRR